MAWTLEAVVNGVTYNWTNATWTSITNGYRVTISVPGNVLSGDKVRVADHHGRWSSWVAFP